VAEKKKDEFDEKGYKKWYSTIVDLKAARGLALNPDPDDPRHFYDHRSAFSAGLEPTGDHGDSRFKLPGHPRMYLKMSKDEQGNWKEDPKGDWIDTKTMAPAEQKDVDQNDRIREGVLDALKRLGME
jgi:hypothetical protein